MGQRNVSLGHPIQFFSIYKGHLTDAMPYLLDYQLQIFINLSISIIIFSIPDFFVDLTVTIIINPITGNRVGFPTLKWVQSVIITSII